MKEASSGGEPGQISASGLGPGKQHRIGKDFAERANLIFDAGHALFGDAYCDHLAAVWVDLFGAAKLEHGGAGRVRNFEPIDQIIAAPVAQRVEWRIVKRPMRYDYEPVAFEPGFERGKDRFIQLAEGLIHSSLQLPEVRIDITGPITELFNLELQGRQQSFQFAF